MSGISSLQAVVPEATAITVLFVLLSGGLVGMSIRNMFDSIMSEEDDGGSDGGDDDMGGGLMGEQEGGGDDLGGLGGLDDGDNLGGFDDGDGFDDMDGDGGGNVDELEHRLDELENEVGSLSSTVNTVRNENEQISETVGEVEENVRKLLDIYEMVTRGVNPFADDIESGLGGPGEDGSFGLFADDGGETEEDIDEDIAEADAEGFFDDDLVGEEEPMEANADIDDVLGGSDDGRNDDEFQDSFEEGFDDEAAFEPIESGGDGGGDGVGTSFEDLKDEYESGDADWAEGVDDEVATNDGLAMDDDDDELADDELFDEVIEEESADEPELTEEAMEVEAETAQPAESEQAAEPEQAVEPEPEQTVETGSETAKNQATGTSTDTDDGKPYLATLPEGFAADLVVIEWLEYLVDEVGARETARAIDYYESIGWIDARVAQDLQEYLRGFDDGGSGSLTIDHHTKSLQYISQLDGDGGAGFGQFQGGGLDGLQR